MGSLLLHDTLFSNTVEKTEGPTFFTQSLLSSFPVSCSNYVSEFYAIYRKQFSDDLIDMFLSCKDFVRSHSVLCYSEHWSLQIILALFNKYI